MSEERALVKSEDFDVRGTALEVYGSRESIREMVERLMSFHPAAREVGKEGLLGAAHLAHLVGASPLPSVNEIHIWKDDKGKNCVTLGVNYYRRRANELGGVYWVDEPRLMTEEERAARAITGNDYAALARAARRDDVDQFVARMMELARGSSFKDVFAAALQMHTRTGVGSCRRDSYAKKNRPPAWTALKGAEIDLFRQLFPNLEQKPEPEQMARIIQEIPQSGIDDDTLTMEEIEELARMRDRGEALDAELDELGPEELQERGERAGAILYGRGDDDPCPPEGCAGSFEEDDVDAILDEALGKLNLDEIEEIPFGEEDPEPTEQEFDAAFGVGEPEPEPEYTGVQPEILRDRLRTSALWLKDNSRPSKREMGDRAQPPDPDHVKALNIVLKAGLQKGRPKASAKEIDEARKDLVQYVYQVRSTNSLTAKEVGSLRVHFASPAGSLYEKAAAEMWAIVEAHRKESGQQGLPGM